MTNYGSVHNFKRCKGKHVGRPPAGMVCLHRVRWHRNSPQIVAENKFGTKSIWIRKGADRYP